MSENIWAGTPHPYNIRELQDILRIATVSFSHTIVSQKPLFLPVWTISQQWSTTYFVDQKKFSSKEYFLSFLTRGFGVYVAVQ